MNDEKKGLKILLLLFFYVLKFSFDEKYYGLKVEDNIKITVHVYTTEAEIRKYFHTIFKTDFYMGST